MKHIVIIGNGIAGITAARHVRKMSDAHITVISEETQYFFSRTALMYVYMGHMKFEHTQPYEDEFWQKNRIELVQDRVTEVDFDRRELTLKNHPSICYDELVLATGSRYNLFDWPGQDLKGVQGLYSYPDLQKLEENTHAYNAPRKDRRVERAVIVGGGLIGVELAEMLLSRDIEVSVLVREPHYWGNVLPKEEAEMIQRHMAEHGVEVRCETELKEIIGDDDDRVKAVITSKGDQIDCEFVGLTAGVHPNVEFLEDSGLDIDKGILVDEHLRTNQPNVYAIGDCAQIREPRPGRKPIEPVWYTGRMMGEVCALNLCGIETPYAPGPWFNSAKFFDIEYQVYGEVPVEPDQEQQTFYWEHSTENRALRFVFEKESHRILGVNTFGVRLRHALFDQWIREGATVEYVLENLRQADFETEFYKRHWKAIIAQFNRQFDADVKLAPFRWQRIFSNFRKTAS